jgi:hypothetical protein
MKRIAIFALFFLAVAASAHASPMKFMPAEMGAQNTTAAHSVVLTWTDTDTVAGFNLYKATGICPAAVTTASSNPTFTRLNAAILTLKTFTDLAVGNAGSTWCYYATAVDGAGNESPASNLAGAIIPMAAPVLRLLPQ